jgi:diguanylate cyclase (GGDEF)-like protein
MTLSRQLLTLILVTFLLIFSGTFWISVENTRSYLMLQLATQTQNAADSLGLSLVPHMQNRDIAAMDTMVNAVFDSGYYKSLRLESISGETLIDRENTSSIEGVPQWFIDNLTLETPHAESVITTGWIQSSRLKLVAHPGFAYKKLWETSTAMLWWSLLAFFVSLIAVSLILRAILRPLDAVEQQALAISKREFPIVENIPRTRELKRVVLAMNKMSAKVESFISMLSERAEQMRKDAYYDALTGLINRRGFTTRLESFIMDKEKGGSGSLAVIRMSNFAAYNQQFGHQAGDELLVEVGKLLTKVSDQYHASVTARIGGTDFSITLPLADAEVAAEFGESFSGSLNELASTMSIDEIAQVGIACFDSTGKIGEILADADAALSLAEHQGANAYAIQTTKSEAVGNQAWKVLITQAMQRNHVRLMAQPVVNQQREQIYNEVLIRIRDEADNDVSPGSFASMAERLGMNSVLDSYVIEKATEILEQDSSRKLGVNISGHSIRDENFLARLAEHFSKHKGVASSMYFEVSEYGLLHDITAANRFIEQVHAHHGMIVMEHFGTRLSSFQTLRQLKLDYIKLDGSYIRNIVEHNDNRFFLQTVADIAHGLDIKVIAEQVETEEEFQTLKTLGIDAMQGYYFSKPKPLTETGAI